MVFLHGYVTCLVRKHFGNNSFVFDSREEADEETTGEATNMILNYQK